MVQTLRMPMLGNTMEAGVLQEWVTEEGGDVETDGVVAIVESEKTVADITADRAGVLARVDVEEGEEVPPGTVLGVVVGPGESLADAPEPRSRLEPTEGEDDTGRAGGPGGDASSDEGDEGAGQTERAVRAAPGARKLAAERGIVLDAVEGTGPEGAVLRADIEEHSEGSDADGGEGPSRGRKDHPVASPSTRRLAREQGVSLDAITPTGIGGRITDTDVRSAAGTLPGQDVGTSSDETGQGTGGDSRMSGPPPSDPERLGVTVTEERELVGTRRIIAERMSRSARNAPHVTLDREASVGQALTVADELAAAHDAPIGFTDIIVGAVVRALEQHPECNAWFEAERLRLVDEVNVAVAADTENGLVAPVVREAGRRSLEGIAHARREQTEAVLSGEHTATDLQGGTFTVSNLGMFGVDAFDPIINPPQVAILGIGRIRDRDGDRTCTLSLSFDHRVLDGADAARFLQAVVSGVESPSLVVADRSAAGVDAGLDGDPKGTPRRGTATDDGSGPETIADAVGQELERQAREVAAAHGWPTPTIEVELGEGRPVVTVNTPDTDSRATLKRLAYAACRESAFADTIVGLRDPEVRVG